MFKKATQILLAFAVVASSLTGCIIHRNETTGLWEPSYTVHPGPCGPQTSGETLPEQTANLSWGCRGETPRDSSWGQTAWVFQDFECGRYGWNAYYRHASGDGRMQVRMNRKGRNNDMEGTAHGTRRGYPFSADIAYGNMTTTRNYSIYSGSGISPYQASDEISRTVRGDARRLNAACEDYRPNRAPQRGRSGYYYDYNR